MDVTLSTAAVSASRTTPARRFCLIWLTAVVLLLVLVGAFDAIIDPYDVIGMPRVSGINALKTYANRHEAMTKTYQIERVRPRTVLLGSSRVDIGLDPSSGLWPDRVRPVFNYGVDGTGLPGIYADLRQAAATGRVAHAILVLDFELFWFPSSPHPAIDEAERRDLLSPDGRRNPHRLRQRLQDIFLATLSMSALEDSADTLWQQHKSFTSDVTPLGFGTDGGFRRAVRQDGYYDLFAQKEPLITARAEQAARILGGWDGDLPGMDVLRNMLAFCQTHGIEITLVIPPYNAGLLDIFRNEGLGRWFEIWKRQLTAALPAKSDLPVSLWDFSGSSAYTTEPLPVAADRGAVSLWFWEYDHFKAALGQKIVERILGGGPSDFGTRLVRQQISAVVIPAVR